MELDPKYDDYDFPVVSTVTLSGHPGHLSPQQQAQVHQFRMMLEAQGFTKRLDTLTLVCFPPSLPSSPFSHHWRVGWAPNGRLWLTHVLCSSCDSCEHGSST